MDRRSFVRAGAATAAAFCWPVRAEPPRDVTFVEDFDELWTTLGERYCFFADKKTDWQRVRALYRPAAVAAETDEAFTEVVRRTLAELYDIHTHLSDPPDGAPRWPLYDLMAERRSDRVVVAAIAANGAAETAGLMPGDTILTVDGQPIEEAVRKLMPRCLTAPDPEADAFAVNTAVSGRRGQDRRFLIGSSGTPRNIALPVKPRTAQPDVEWRRLDRGIGYIAIRSFADAKVAATFDTALAELRDAPGLIIDVRYNGGGDTAVARPIMGRFITATKPYAMMRRREGAGLGGFWTEYVDPAGPFPYTRPVVVLANHWSGSMAEGFPMGMRGIGRATIVGTRMMGLGAAVFPIRLDRTGLQAQYSAEPVYDVHHQPRWLMRPDVEVPEGADVLAAGVKALIDRIASY